MEDESIEIGDIPQDCRTPLQVSSDYGATHLMEHYDKTCKKRKREMDIRRSQELTSHVFNQEESRHELAKMVILHDYPLGIVEHVGFRRYVASIQPRFNMVSRNTLNNDILKIYNDEKVKCYQLLDKLKCRIAITTHMKTSSNTKKGFMAVTAHFIDDSWILQSCILRFICVPPPHTAEVLAKALVDSLMDWNVDWKVSTITLDNYTTNETMLHHLLDRLSTKHLLLDGKVLHMRCFAHSLNLMMKDGLEIIGGAIERIRDSVVYWTDSRARIEKFEKAARQLNISCTQKLSLDCKTRWNSTYLMLETAIIYKDVFRRVKILEKDYKSLPTKEDWESAIDICGKLKIFYQITEMLSGTLYCTSNFYFPKICGIKLKLDEWVKSPNTMIQNMAKKMLEKYEQYWDACHIMMGVAVVLDPRYKMKLVQFYLPLIYGDRSQSKIDEIRNKCYDLFLHYQSRSTISKGSSSCSGGLESTMLSCVSGTSDALDFDEMFEQYVASTVSTAKVTMRMELDMYLEENLLPRTPDFDVLSWWKINGVKYPNLQRMARDILAIPVSTVASESTFSASGRPFGSYHSKLHPDTLEALMCSRSWLWNEAKDTCSTFGDSEACLHNV